MSSPSGATEIERERPFASSAMMLNALPDGVLIVDRAGVIRQANLIAAELLGFDAAALAGRRLGELLDGALLEPAGDPDAVFEIAGRSLCFRQQPLLSDDGAAQVVGTIVLINDRTDELAAKREQYDYISRALHDVRVPLQAIGGAAEGLLRGWFGPLADEQREFVGMIKENASRQGDLFNSLFDVYTLAEGLVQLNTERLSVEGVIHEVAHECADSFAARDIDLALELGEAMAPALADRRRLRQILLALLDNACKYTYAGGAVVVRAAEQDGMARVDVQDTGVGIRPVDQPQVFKPFFRGESPLREGRYGGLSLAIARRLAELHGGQLWFESAEGQGSTFSFTLPTTVGD